MRLIIAEKPSLARAIANALPGSSQRQEGAIRVGDSVVSWCLGHLLEQAAPEAYDPSLKRWQLDHLPIVPDQWRLIPRSKARGQLKILRGLVKQASQVVHAGDPDREGQLLVQEVIEYLGWHGKVERLLINDLNRPAVQHALANLSDNRAFEPLFRAAETRSRADWLYGINLTRAWTLTGRQAGHDGMLSVGRVQTPVLGLVARRDRDIARFEPRPFHVLWADFQVAKGVVRGWWQPGEHQPLDDQGRLLSRGPAETLLAHLPGAQAQLAGLDAQHKRQVAPLPYSLSSLQVDAARRYRLSAKQVLDGCQALYERHQLITYPRSDCRYLPEAHWATAAGTLKGACRDDDTLRAWLADADFRRRSRAFNDKQVGAHHALAPTGKPADLSQLSSTQANLFRLIARNMLAQFYPAFETREVKAEFSVLDERFRAQGREILALGWKPLFTTRDEAPPLPPLNEGESAQVIDQGIDDKQTRPPEPFTDASLIKAMMNIARYVDDPAVKRTLRDTDGLGTEATRAGIIETLLTRGYLVRHGGALRATRTGQALIAALPDAATRPERTAMWEQRLRTIAEGTAQQDAGDSRHEASGFLDKLVVDLRELLAGADAQRMRQALASAEGFAGSQQSPRRNTRKKAAEASAGKRRRRRSTEKP